MGWLFAVALGLHRRSRAAVLQSLVPIAPAVSTVPGELGGTAGFAFDPGVLDGLFGQLAPSEPAREVPDPRDDPYTLARDLIGKGQLDTAAAEVHRAIRRGAPPAAGAALLGDVFAKRGLFGEALERYREASALAPEDVGIGLGEGSALVALGRGADAIVVAERLAALGPDRADTLVMRARARELVGDLEGAVRDSTRASTLSPGRADLLLLRGSVLRKQGDRAAALDALTAALELDPSLVQAWYEKGVVEEELQRPGAARAAYQRALELLPTFLDAGLALGDLLRRTGLTQEATRLLVDLLLAEPYALDALLLLGRTLADEGRTPDAIAAL